MPIKHSEEDFLVGFTNKEHVVEMSIGYIVGESMVITAGPLRNLDGCIEKIDRPKRTAIVGMDMFGQTTRATVGLEIVEKRAKV